MALAFLKFKGINGDTAEFESDIGTNNFYKIKIGKSKTNTKGLELIDEVIYETPLFAGPEFNVFNSRFTVTIPADKFNSQSRYLQIISFKDENKKSPAVSKVVQVFPDLDLLNQDLPAIPSAFNITDMNQYQTTNNTRSCRAVSFSFEEATLSTPMFWDALIEAARVLTPSVVNTLAGLVGGSNGQSSNNETIVNVINAILNGLKQGQGAAAPPPVATTAPVRPSSLTSAAVRSQSYSRNYLPFQRRIFKKEDMTFNGFSRQQALPLAALAPLLGPLLQQAPQLLQVLADSPGKLLNVLNEGINQQGQLQLQKKQADQQHIENLLGESGRNFLFLQQILRSAASALPAETPPPANPVVAAQSSQAFSLAVPRSRSSLIIQKGNPITVNGKPKFVYSGQGSIKLQAHLNITEGTQKGKQAKAIVNLLIKDIDTRKTLLEKSYRLKDIAVNSMQELELLSAETQNLPRNKDMLVSASFRYMGAGNRSYTGGADTHLIFITDDYFYKGIGNMIGEAIPLTDRNRYRVFWNKIWEGGAKTKKRWEINLGTKYYIYYCPDQSANGRVETRIQQVQPESESERELNIEGKMKSGLEITPVELNNLIPSISSYNSLELPRLGAFKTDELSRDYNSEALISLKLKGKTSETGMIWTYPEIGLFEFVLNKAARVDHNGQVTEIQEEKIVFPKPVSIHFVGEKTSNSFSSSGEEGTEDTDDNADTIGTEKENKSSRSEGYEQVFDIKVELRPVELAPVKINKKR